MTSVDDPFSDWYSTPLSQDDIIAGASLVALTIVFLLLYLLVLYILWSSSKEIIGFRYLISSSLANILCMIQYGMLNGMAILCKSRLVSIEDRPWLQLYIDWVWFACCFHLPIIAWSRLHAIFAPHSFRNQKQWMSYSICIVFTWFLALVLVLSLHWQPFYALFYYEPAVYGMLTDEFPKYQSDGHSQLFMGIHSVVVILPLIFYSLVIIQLVKHKREMRGVEHQTTSRRQSVETKLILPCILSTVVFVIGQVAITIGTGSGPWASWMICFLFFMNSALEPILLIVFSPFVRRAILHIFSKDQEAIKITVGSAVNSKV